MIELSYSPERRKIEMLQYWLDNNVHPLWSNVVEALEEMDKRALAAQIKDDYLYSAAVSEEGMLCMLCLIVGNVYFYGTINATFTWLFLQQNSGS